jgi:hypothetical protein
MGCEASTAGAVIPLQYGDPETGLTYGLVLRARERWGIGDLPSETRENVSTAGTDIASVARGPGNPAWCGNGRFIRAHGWDGDGD